MYISEIASSCPEFMPCKTHTIKYPSTSAQPDDNAFEKLKCPRQTFTMYD